MAVAVCAMTYFVYLDMNILCVLLCSKNLQETSFLEVYNAFIVKIISGVN